MAGATARAEQLESISDNLANAQTTGFKAERPAFQAFLAKANGPGPTDKVFTAAVATGIDLTPGDARVTDNPMDIFPEGNGFLAVSLGSGRVGYTRNGELKIGAGNTLMAAGHAVLGLDGKPITIPPGAITGVLRDGVITADGQAVGQLALFGLTGDVRRIGQSVYAPTAQGAAAAIPTSRFRIGELENANASPLEAAVSMISAQRHFETAMQAITTYRKMDDRTIEIGKIR